MNYVFANFDTRNRKQKQKIFLMLLEGKCATNTKYYDSKSGVI